MKKLIVKSTMMLLFSCLLCLGIQLPNTVKANEVNKYQSVMVQYLEAFKNYDIDTIVDISKDSRAVTKEEYKNMLMEFKYDPNQKLKSYEITGSRKIDNGEIFSVKTEFLNGAIYNMEFTVSYIDNKLMVSNMNRISIVNEGKYIPTPSFRTQVCTWDDELSQYIGDAVSFTRSSKFQYSSNTITLNFRQYATSGSRSLKVKYSVVDHWMWGDDVRASQWVYGENPDYARQIKLYLGSGETFKNYRIKVENYTPASIKVFGEGYCY